MLSQFIICIDLLYVSLKKSNSVAFRRGSPISAQEATLHAQALRINAGRASSFRFFEDGQSGVLLACSLTLGAVAFEWRFDKVIGMRGPATIGTVIQVM